MGKPHSALFGWSAKDIARICQVDLATARRWKRGAFCPPKTAVMILEADLGCFGPSWRGWRVQGGDLISPDQWRVSRNDALAVPLMHGQIAALRQEIRQLKAELETVRMSAIDQPSPPAWLANMK